MSPKTRRNGSSLEIRLLGSVEVVKNGSLRPLVASRKTRALLAYLVLAARPCRREDLCELLWSDAADPRGELRWSLSKLRKVMGTWLVTTRDTVTIGGEGLTIDALVFRRVAAQLIAGQEPEEALPPWRGHPLEDADVPGSHRYHSWWISEREPLIELHTLLLHASVDRVWSTPHQALSAARKLVAEYPFDEWGHGRVAQALERAGRVADAHAYLNETRQALGRELGLPVAAVMTALPAEPRPSAYVRDSNRGHKASSALPRLGIPTFQTSPGEESLDAIAAHLRSDLAIRVWRARFCDVVPDCPADGAIRKAEYAYTLRGTLTRLGQGLRLSLWCVDEDRGNILWAARFGPDPAGQDHLGVWIGSTVGAIQSSIQIAEMRRAGRAGDQDNEAGNALLEALALAGKLEPVANRQSVALIERVLEDVPDEPRALALAAWCYAQRCVYNWSSNVDKDRAEAERLAVAATHRGADDPNCLTIIAAARTMIADHNGARLVLSQALKLNPHSPWAHSRSGWLANYLDRPDHAIRRFQASLRLAPFDPVAFNSQIGLGVAHFIKGEYSTAIRCMEKGLALNPRAIWAYRNLIPAYVVAGRRSDAERGVDILLKEHPSLSIAAVENAMVFSKPVMTRLSDGLSRAGLSPS